MRGVSRYLVDAGSVVSVSSVYRGAWFRMRCASKYSVRVCISIFRQHGYPWFSNLGYIYASIHFVRAPHPHRNAARLTYVANGLASQVLVADLLTALHVDDFSVSGGVGKFHTFYPRV